jgi:hypothetical protein
MRKHCKSHYEKLARRRYEPVCLAATHEALCCQAPTNRLNERRSNRCPFSDETVTIPADRIQTGEIVCRIGGNLPDLGLADRDLLIVEPRPDGNAAAREFVSPPYWNARFSVAGPESMVTGRFSCKRRSCG